jgi:hypothetical protein
MFALNINEIEYILRNYSSIIDSFSFISYDLTIQKNLKKSYTTDIGKLHTREVGVYGVLPGVYQTTGLDFV